jgi:signal transduction histidine kinase
MGIGLALCRTIAEAHGGELGFHNNPEGGATFYLLLPLLDV